MAGGIRVLLYSQSRDEQKAILTLLGHSGSFVPLFMLSFTKSIQPDRKELYYLYLVLVLVQFINNR